jgi:hypothetical protein
MIRISFHIALLSSSALIAIRLFLTRQFNGLYPIQCRHLISWRPDLQHFADLLRRDRYLARGALQFSGGVAPAFGGIAPPRFSST